MEKIAFKDLVIDTDRKTCYLKDREIPLTKTEYNLLLYLMSNKNKVFTRKELTKSVWDIPVSHRAVDTTVSRLRKKLKDLGGNLTTRIGFGYGLLEEHT